MSDEMSGPPPTQVPVIISFPVMIDAFNQRKSVSVVIQPYDQPLPVVLTN